MTLPGNVQQRNYANKSHNSGARIIDAKVLSFQFVGSMSVVERLQKIQKLLSSDFPEYIQPFENIDHSECIAVDTPECGSIPKHSSVCCANHEDLWLIVSTSTCKPESNQCLSGWPCSLPKKCRKNWLRQDARTVEKTLGEELPKWFPQQCKRRSKLLEVSNYGNKYFEQ